MSTRIIPQQQKLCKFFQVVRRRTMYNGCMIRTNIYITEHEKKEVEKLAKKTGVSFSEMLRRLLDQQLEKIKHNA